MAPLTQMFSDEIDNGETLYLFSIEFSVLNLSLWDEFEFELFYSDTLGPRSADSNYSNLNSSHSDKFNTENSIENKYNVSPLSISSENICVNGATGKYK